MARKRGKAVSSPHYHAHIGRDGSGRLCFLGYQAEGCCQVGGKFTEVAVVDIGRPFEVRVPSIPRKGSTGLVIDGMTGTNAEPWSPSRVLTGARLGWFGLRLIKRDGKEGAREQSPA
jgi:hypothetical protein